ncbi:hypothetical protein DFH08DRAFT_802394 [Mycena albidolilacea]|uniref:Uncharacterized protein n=1 Tax=Mycena albidolilacea TaxID=1033008 RepID=A0AAD7AIK1_9AGAR|nr:hypothetical protein DFH08DRAFT_802394 [Mycena albidolilacea]
MATKSVAIYELQKGGFLALKINQSDEGAGTRIPRSVHNGMNRSLNMNLDATKHKASGLMDRNRTRIGGWIGNSTGVQLQSLEVRFPDRVSVKWVCGGRHGLWNKNDVFFRSVLNARGGLTAITAISDAAVMSHGSRSLEWFNFRESAQSKFCARAYDGRLHMPTLVAKNVGALSESNERSNSMHVGKGILLLQCFCCMQRHLQRQYCSSLRQLNLQHMVNSATELRQSAAIWRQQNTCKHSAAARQCAICCGGPAALGGCDTAAMSHCSGSLAAVQLVFSGNVALRRFKNSIRWLVFVYLIDAPTDPAHLYGRFNPGFSIFFSLSFELDMRSNNQTSSHYREHSRQQDGCTVLAPGPPAGPELPPPYTPEAAPQRTSAAATTAGGVTLAFDVPINNNIIGATPVTQMVNFGRDILFAVNYTKICNYNLPTETVHTT